MSSVHVASAANEVAQALPSTATVTVSKHGIQAIETLRLDAQTASSTANGSGQVSWSRTFSGMEILTNPILRYRTLSALTTSNAAWYFQSLTNFRLLRESLRPTSDPMANAAGNLQVTVNNASMSITPSRDHRIVTSFYPTEKDVAHQRKHYGLNQLDQYAESGARTFQTVSVDDVEKQHNTNALRENYPSKIFATIGGTEQQVGDSDFTHVFVDVHFDKVTGGSGVAAGVASVRVGGHQIGGIKFSAAQAQAAGVQRFKVVSLVSGTVTNASVPITSDLVDLTHPVTLNCEGDFDPNVLVLYSAGMGLCHKDNAMGATAGTSTQLAAFTPTGIKVVHDIYQPLNHPYFHDNVMRDNTLVNVRYFDCQLTIENSKRLIECGKMAVGKSNVGDTWSTSLLLKNDTNIAGRALGLDPQLWIDLVTPSVPLPTISDKVISTYHTITAPAVELDSSGSYNDKPKKGYQSGNIQLAQVPDMIYVFIRSSKDLSTYTNDATHVPTRLGVITELRVRTPQNSAFLINMDQESLYQMSCRNGSKQSRSAFMSSLGSVIAIDPEKDLGGYTNGVLVPFTFEVVADFSVPLRSGDDTESDMDGKDLKMQRPLTAFDSTSNESWTMFVVCELNGHLYLMSDGTGKQTKSNLTVTEVADAVSDGIHHPSTFPGARTSKMDAGILGELARGPGDADDGVRSALRQ